MKYDPSKFEEKWQQAWEKAGIYSPKDSGKNKYYTLVEFPYPSGDGLHVGHVRSYTAMDVVSRKRRMEGFNVLYPIGWDAFGLPTENYAIKTGISPQEATKKNTDTFRRQLKSLGFSFDWEREINTTDPEYYKWTQWMFLKFFEKGMAYKAKVPINWCPKDKIGLANEEVVDGKCERCGTAVEKRDKEQWMIRITKYADKLLEGLKEVDYIPQAKIQQQNWIGRSEGAEIEFKIEDVEGLKKNLPKTAKVFTTRPDTLFGATYLVVAPEHAIAAVGASGAQKMTREVEVYIADSRKKAEDERTAEGKIKTGVELKGIVAVNPATNEKIPVWVADYVLPQYGTGAIMAVPAHDERDFAFAKKFHLPIIQVIARETGIKRENEEWRDGGCGVVFDPATQKYAAAKWNDDGRLGLFAGGLEKGEDAQSGILREVTEESGLFDFAKVEKIRLTNAHFHNRVKNVNRVTLATCLLVILKSAQTKPVQRQEHEKFEVVWVSAQELLDDLKKRNGDLDHDHWIDFIQQAVGRAIELEFDKTSSPSVFHQTAFTGDGKLINSGKFDGMESEKAKAEITKFVGGKIAVQYKLRDWVFSRQRYWGEPIPIIHCSKCGQIPVPEKDLPVKLPKVEKYQPTDTGESPLANISSWVNVKCPKCKGDAKRETDVMPNWAGSSWYFMRYADSKNKKAFASKEKLKYWMPVDWYNGGMEHTVLHLLYSRFWNRFLHDLGYVPVAEPYKKRTSHGLILAEGGVKMSKSKGNVVNPDGLVKEFGADALRLYEMFIGPFNQAVAWDPRGIVGTSRFLEKVWAIGTTKVLYQSSAELENKDLERLLHKTLKKVSEDVEAMAFNTAVSSMMMFINAVAEQKEVSRQTWETFLKMLAPFAPFTAEELWTQLTTNNSQPAKEKKLSVVSGKLSVHLQPWPEFDPKLLVEDTFELVIQVNGKIRDKVSVPMEITQADAEKLALSRDEVRKWIPAAAKKVIFVKNRLINFIV